MFKDTLFNERGGLLFLAAFASIMLMVCGVTAYYMATTEVSASGQNYEKAKAHYLAETGIQRAIAELTAGMNDGWDDDLAGADGEIGTEDDGILSFGEKIDCYADNIQSSNPTDIPSEETPSEFYVGHYDVRIGDGRPENERTEPCNKVIVQSLGVSGKNVSKLIEAEFESFSLLQPPSTAFIVPGTDTTAFPDPDFSGQSWVIDGNDMNPDGTPGSSPTVPGVGVNSNPENFLNALKDNQLDQIKGAGYDETASPVTPSIQDMDVKVNLTEAAENMMKIADYNVLPGTYSTFSGYGSTDDYQVTVCEGDLHLSGQIQGSGVLVVTGNFKMTGTGSWNGIIIALGGVEFAGGGNQFLLHGAVMAGTSSGLKKSADFSIKGNADLYYSSQTIEKARADATGVFMKSWRSKPSKVL